MLGTVTAATKNYLGKDVYDQPVSEYNPSQEIKDFTFEVKKAYQVGDEIMNRPFEEFNGLSLIQRINEDQKTWLAWQPEPSQDPEEDWRWSGVRPITRNKVISTAAHLTAQLIFPNIFAQNEQDEEDRDAAYVMRELVEYNIQHSEYEMAFLYGVISALVNPITYFKIDYVEAEQEVLEESKRIKVRDDIFSGFQYSLVPSDEVLIANPYCFEIQKQPFLIHKRRISFDEASALHKSHENWKHIRPGIICFYGDNSLFYDIEDSVSKNLVEEITYYNRRKDCQAVFVNGVYLGNKKVDQNPIQHRTNKNKPKYPLAKMGAQPIDGMRFFFYKSLVSTMSNDQELYDRMWQMAMDGTFLATFPPIITVGAGRIDKSVVSPATVTDLRVGAEINPLTGIANPVNAFGALREAESALSQDSQDPQLAGQTGKLPQTARQSMLIQQNAETNLSIISRMIGATVKDIGELIVEDILRYQTSGEVAEILGGVPKMKYKTFALQNKIKEGRTMTEIIKFTDRYSGHEMTKAEKEQAEFMLLEQAGENRELYEVNPNLFSKLNFLITVDYDQMLKKNDKFDRAFKLEVYDRSIGNPMIDQQAITRDFLLEPLLKGDASKYMAKQVQGLVPDAKQPKSRMAQRVMQSTALEGAVT